MDRVFWAIAAASVVHIVEEYVLPGGFHRWLNERLEQRGSNALPLEVLAYALEAPPAGTAAGALALGAAWHAAPPLALVLAR